jgi:hypothetical protein
MEWGKPMMYDLSKKQILMNRRAFLSASGGAVLLQGVPGMAQQRAPCTWHPEAENLEFRLSRLSGVLACNKSHHFSNVVHTPTGTLVSPDEGRMKHVGLLNFFRVLVRSGYLTELRVEKPLLQPEDDGITMIWPSTIRRQAKVTVRFTFIEPNIIDMDLQVESRTTYPDFEILLSAYLAPGFESGAYVSTNEMGPVEPEQIRIIDQPMIHGVWPFFPRDEAGAHLLTDGRHQKGRWYWRMAIGRRYGMPLAFFSKGKVDALLMGRPEDVYAVGATYSGDTDRDNIAAHRSLYLSLFGDDLQAGEGRRTQMRMIIDDFGSSAIRHRELYEQFLADVEPIPRSFQINPETEPE